MAAEVIPGDGRIRVSVVVRNPKTGQKHEKQLLADGGSPYTLITPENAGALGGTPGPAKGKHGGSDRIEIEGLTMDVEVEDRSSGIKVTKSCSKISAMRWPPAMKQGLDAVGCEGLLGMDQYDALRADPVKTRDGKSAYMRSRGRIVG